MKGGGKKHTRVLDYIYLVDGSKDIDRTNQSSACNAQLKLSSNQIAMKDSVCSTVPYSYIHYEYVVLVVLSGCKMLVPNEKESILLHQEG